VIYIPRKPLFWAVSAAHFANDFFMGIRGMMMAFISAYILPLTHRQIGLAVSLVELSGAISQPLFGWLADKTGGRWLGSFGVVWVLVWYVISILIASTGQASYWGIVLPMAIAAIGSAAYHPVGSMHATGADPKRAGSNAAWFFLMGQLGLSVGPALVGVMVTNAHSHFNDFYRALLGVTFHGRLFETGTLNSIIILAVILFPSVIWMALLLPNVDMHRAARPAPVKAKTSDSPRRAITWGLVAPFLLLTLAVFLRNLSQQCVIAFIPTIFEEKGWTPAEYGLLTGTFWVAGGLTGLFFGGMADRFGPKRMIILSLFVSGPAVFLLMRTDGGAAFLLAIIIGAMGGTHSLILLIAQRMLPGRAGFASGFILGMIFSANALGNLVLGELIDAYGVNQAFTITAVITIISAALWFGLPSDQPKRLVSEAAT